MKRAYQIRLELPDRTVSEAQILGESDADLFETAQRVLKDKDLPSVEVQLEGKHRFTLSQVGGAELRRTCVRRPGYTPINPMPGPSPFLRID